MVANDLDDLRASLEAVPDPEIPAISVLDLGIVRDLRWDGAGDERTLHVALTPTYAGCPAMRAIERDVAEHLRSRGVRRVVVETRLAPAWTTDWLSAAGRQKLREYGISPPSARASVPEGTLDLIGLVDDPIGCPRCGSAAVELVSRFGSTACKALYRCTRCREPFDHFKAH